MSFPTASPARRFFLFLEIQDRDFNAFYDDATHILTGRRPTQAPHLTIRGPYKRPIEQSEVARCRKHMQHSVLKLGPVGRFSNPDEEVVYLEVDGVRLREIWWKPDFTIGSVGYNPHISIYRGPDRTLADRLMDFAPLREVEFLCAEYRILPVLQDRNESHKLRLDPIVRASNHRRFIEAGRVPNDFFERLSRLVRHEPNSIPASQLDFDL